MIVLTNTDSDIRHLQSLRSKMLTVYHAHYQQLLAAGLTEMEEVHLELRDLRIAIGLFAADLQEADPRLNIRPAFMKRYSRIIYRIHDLERYLSPSNITDKR